MHVCVSVMVFIHSPVYLFKNINDESAQNIHRFQSFEREEQTPKGRERKKQNEETNIVHTHP